MKHSLKVAIMWLIIFFWLTGFTTLVLVELTTKGLK